MRRAEGRRLMNTPEQCDQHLLETVRLFTLAAGGDGDGWIVSSRYRALADALAAWEAEPSRVHFIARHEWGDVIGFWNDQEVIYFMDPHRRPRPSWTPDIVVEVC